MSGAQNILTAAKRRIFAAALTAGKSLVAMRAVVAYTRIGRCVTLIMVEIAGSKRNVTAEEAGVNIENFAIHLPGFAGLLLICRHAPELNAIPLRINAKDVFLDIESPVYRFDARTFAEKYLAPLASTTREKIGAQISLAVSTQEEPDLTAYRPLIAVREVLATPLMPPVNIGGLHIASHVDFFAQIDSRKVYLRGWLLHADGPAAKIILTAPDGQRIDITEKIYTHRRLDIEKTFNQPAYDDKQFGYGFIVSAQLPRPCPAVFGWKLYLRDSAGNECEHSIKPANHDLAEIRREILSDIAHQKLGDDTLMENHLHSALQGLQARHAKGLGIEMVRDFGPPVDNPIASIIIPLYIRYDFLMHQMAQFADDPEMQRAELIYVLDSPEQTMQLMHHAIEVYAIYRVPFKIIFLKANAGYSHANNIGASLATSPLLLLLNSDVIPAAPGWLGSMARFYEHTPGIGALGPKLLFEDESLQHAGMYFDMNETEQLWLNRHYFKGLHRLLPVACKNRPVPAVTGAAMMISRELFNSVGGLAGDYVHGDFEDSDLCLRLSKKGLTHWYLADVELFHLEGQSYPSQVRVNASRYNRWLHSRMWGKKIAELMKQAGFAETNEE